MMRTTRLHPVTRADARSAFTLLEVLLASMIGVLLMAALYVAVDVQLRHAQAGRDAIEQSTLARALLTQMAGDIKPSVAPPMPASTGSSGSSAPSASGGSSGGGATGTSSSSAASPTSGGSTSGSGSSSASPSSSTPSSATPTSGLATSMFNLGVQGDSGQLILSVSRVPREINWAPDAYSSDARTTTSDLRLITYWLAGGSDNPLGLARQEILAVTSDQAPLTLPLDTSDEAMHVVAEEVKSLTFSYFDGTSWQDGWDGTQPGADGKTAMGPPRLIAITIGLPAPNNPNGDLKYYRHVVAIPTANGEIPQTTTTGASQ